MGDAGHSDPGAKQAPPPGALSALLQALSASPELRAWAYGRPFTSSYRRRVALPLWLRRYNERRSHAGTGGAAPITRLRSAA